GFLKAIPIEAINTAGVLMGMYSIVMYHPDLRLVFVNSVFIVIILLSCLNILTRYKNSFKTNEQNYLLFVIMYLFATLGSLYNLIYFNRMLYGVAFLILPTVFYILTRIQNRFRILYIIMFVVFFTGNIMYQSIELINAIKYWGTVN
ncbi:MAG: hypothetical protein WCI62_04755, partial [Erysipelotrichaceae bacterium]